MIFVVMASKFTTADIEGSFEIIIEATEIMWQSNKKRHSGILL